MNFRSSLFPKVAWKLGLRPDTSAISVSMLSPTIPARYRRENVIKLPVVGKRDMAQPALEKTQVIDGRES